MFECNHLERQVIHITRSLLGRNTACLSFVALDKSIESTHVISSTSGSSSQVLNPTQKSGERTRQATLDINAFKGIRTPRQQSHYPPKVSLAPPRAFNG